MSVQLVNGQSISNDVVIHIHLLLMIIVGKNENKEMKLFSD